jgi:hypothetical protein
VQAHGSKSFDAFMGSADGLVKAGSGQVFLGFTDLLAWDWGLYQQ